jgi:protein SCO1
MRSRAAKLVGALAVALLVAGAAIAFFGREPARPEGLRAGAFEPSYPAPDFALRGSDGSEVSLARYRGKVVLLTFGFTYCPAVCPTTLATLAQARGSLGRSADAVQVIFVTVDPERDTAAQMRQYLAAFDKSFVGATGSPEMLKAAREAYGVAASRQGTGADYAMAHTSSIFLIDRAGKLRAMMPFGRDPSDFVHDIKLLLAE